ncbi:hypothetical protein FGO68_gene3688 [Halteria grandinella]|uniref:Uncharacterized protein n=1 Tax=Halteria grandinella TaxID=5974 RepID=A0A8J8P0E6_HALGN|nr:hypothetical protein FGO68_gene3688 [Halteria grandinella]
MQKHLLNNANAPGAPTTFSRQSHASSVQNLRDSRVNLNVSQSATGSGGQNTYHNGISGGGAIDGNNSMIIMKEEISLIDSHPRLIHGGGVALQNGVASSLGNSTPQPSTHQHGGGGNISQLSHQSNRRSSFPLSNNGGASKSPHINGQAANHYQGQQRHQKVLVNSSANGAGVAHLQQQNQNSRHAAQQFSPYNYHGSSMDEITRNHPHNNIIMMLDGGGGSTAAGQASNSKANANCINNGNYQQNKVQQPNTSKLDIMAKMRQQEADRRGALTSADAGRLYQTSSTKFYQHQSTAGANAAVNGHINGAINSSALNRESLQSRLLERINTKKQRGSPVAIKKTVDNEIYLEEEDGGEANGMLLDQENLETERRGKEKSKVSQQQKPQHTARRLKPAKGGNDESQIYYDNNHITVTQENIQEEDDQNTEMNDDEDNERQNQDDDPDMDDEEEYGDQMHAGGSDEYEQHQHQMQQMKAKFKFKIGSSNHNSNNQGSTTHSHQFPITSSTSYGTKFIDLRKTFQNFNANSNKALQTAAGVGVINVPGMMGGLSGAQNPTASYGGSSQSQQQHLIIPGGVNVLAAKQSFVTHYGVSFKDAFNKKSSLQTDNYGSVKLAQGPSGRQYMGASSSVEQQPNTNHRHQQYSNRYDGGSSGSKNGGPAGGILYPHKMAVTSNNFYDANASGGAGRAGGQRFYSNRRIDYQQQQQHPSNIGVSATNQSQLLQSGVAMQKMGMQQIYSGQTNNGQPITAAGRKTFYISDYQKAKQQREWHQQQQQLKGSVHEDALNISAISSQQPGGGGQAGGYFHKPRALSRQAEANIKIEVHRDETIINHLQREQRANMNLMFYDFNGSSSGSKQSQTGTNFYQSGANGGGLTTAGGRPQGVEGGHGGDRVPTRERGYRSAHQNFRRRMPIAQAANEAMAQAMQIDIRNNNVATEENVTTDMGPTKGASDIDDAL